MSWLIWGLMVWGCLVILLATILIVRGIRMTPVCPVHRKRMSLFVDDADHDEYACQAPGCRWCAYVHADGHIQIYEV